MFKHGLDTREAWKRGEDAVVAFERYLDANGYTHERSTEHEDKALGIDLWATKDGVREPYQIKSQGSCPDELVAVELARLDGKYGSGWVFTTKAKWVVFQKNDRFIVIESVRLRKIAEEKVVREETRHINNAMWNYRMYRRKSSTKNGEQVGEDLIMYLVVEDLCVESQPANMSQK